MVVISEKGLLLDVFSMRPLRTCCFLCLSMMSTGCLPATRSQNLSAKLSAEELFRLHCSSCHGDGSGNGHIAGTLKVLPRNLKLVEWQSSVSDQHIARVIREGGFAMKLSPDMPAFRDKLSEPEVQLLVYYLRKLGSVHL